MVTASYPPVEFEHGVPKMDYIAETCIALSSGDALAHSGVCGRAVDSLGGLMRPTVTTMVDAIKQSYSFHRDKRIEERLLAPRGWTRESFYSGRIGVTPDLMVVVDSQISTFDYGVSFIIAGTDAKSGHIYGLRHPGEVDCYDGLGYHAIGIGAMHAVSSLIANSYTPALNAKWATYFVYEAKRNAENAPGVGSMTDLGVIDSGKCQILGNEQIEALKNIYEQRSPPLSEEVTKLVESLTFS